MSKSNKHEHVLAAVTTERRKWGEAIQDAERKIRRLEKQISGLRASIRVFEENIESGAPWPGTGATQ